LFAVIYSFKVKTGKEEDFLEAWSGLTKLIYQYEGSYGSRLHRYKPDEYIAYAQWPDRKTWEESGGSLPEEAKVFSKSMQASCTSIETLHSMEVEADLLMKTPFSDKL